MSLFRLDNKTSIVTGGGSGIGKAIALTFAVQGSEVHILDVNINQAEATAKEIRNEGGIAFTHICDVTNPQELENIFSQIEKVDILVNSAGVSHIGNIQTTRGEDFDRIFQINVKGVYNCLYTAIPKMKENGGGVILNISSIAAIVALADRFAYSMSKGAVAAMTLSVAKDYIKDNIRCNSVSPARVHTPFVDGFLAKTYPGKEQEMFENLSKTQPIGRMATPEEVSKLVLYLCSDEASFITGNDYPIDGGFIKLNS